MNNTIKNEFATNLIAEFEVPELLSMLSMRFIDIAPMWQRIALILGAATVKPPLLMIDEPTYGLNTEEVVRIKRFIKHLSTKIKLMVVLHSQEQALDLADDIVLIAGGRVQFYGTASTFFAKTPPNDVVRQFVQTGSVSIAAPDARREDLADDAVPPPPLPKAALDAIRFFNPPHQLTETLPTVVKLTDTAQQVIQKETSDIKEKVIKEAEAEKLQIIKALEAQVEAIRAKKEVHKQLELTQQKLAQDLLTQERFESSHKVRQADIKASPASAPETRNQALATPKNSTLTTEHIQPLLELPKPSKDGVSIVAGIGRQDASVSRGPAGFSWVVPDMIAGCPMPGVSAPMGYDLDLLANIGITVLITLTEEDIYQTELAAAGLSNVHLPIYDREAPSLSQMHMLLLKMQKLIAEGEVLAVHCLAGLGRTGTVLAAWMIKEGGLSSEEAIRRLRLINPGFIQSAVQETFLAEFENDILRRMR
jgi:atypical dual specificity phosphatase